LRSRWAPLLRTLIFDIGGGIPNGKKFKAIQTGGPSGGCLTEEDLDTPIDYDTLIARGSMMGLRRRDRHG
jgi:NADH:ubiquinone oxidoreductase subunit F (NADH-binding)